MFREILGILSDIVGLVCVWLPPNELTSHWKVIITIGIIILTVIILLFMRQHSEAKVKNYCWGEDGSVTLILDKNAYYSFDMLVSIYVKDENRKEICAIGYVKNDPDGNDLHVQVVHHINRSKMEQIRNSAKQYKRYSIAPAVMHSDVIKINWK